MRYASVVPVRRMPPDRPWLTYAVPDTLLMTVGTLVTIPLRGRQILGVVWEITNSPPEMAVQNIFAVHFTSPFISSWQRRVCEAMSKTGSASLGDVLWRVVPKVSIRTLLKTCTGDLTESVQQISEPDSFLWYRDRQQSLDHIQEIITKHSTSAIAILTPTNDDAEEILSRSEKIGRTAVHLHSKISPTTYAEWYARIRNGEPLVVVGGLSVLALPFPQRPQVILDQAEHHAHKQTAQFPYYDNRAVIDELHIQVHITTPAPGIRYVDRHDPKAPATSDHRQLLSLHGPRQAPLLTDSALDLLDTLIARREKFVCISPRRGYASTTACRSCGTVLSCPHCGRSTAIFRGLADEARCRSCQTSIRLTTTCPKCGSTDWSFHGYGIEQTVATIKRLRPNVLIAPIIDPSVSVDVAVDTYQAYRSLRHIDRLGGVLITSGDSLLTSPDYSVAERAWQYLARLQAEVPRAKIVVQTFEPELPFWQRWLHGDDRSWYEDELAQRRRLHMPPFATQWIAQLQGEKKSVGDKAAELIKLFGQHLTVQALPQRAQSPAKYRLLLSFEDPGFASKLPWSQLFPRPWHLDQHPTSWLD